MNNSSFSADTILTGLLSHPSKHSFSPSIHNTAANILGLDFLYLAFDVLPENLESALSGMRAMNIRGFNLSLPHKRRVLPLLDELSLEVQYTSAANTIVNRKGRLKGFNTDITGFSKSLELYSEIFWDRPALIIGAGGSASAAIYSLIVDFKIKEINITNRTLQNASMLVLNFINLFKDVKFRIVPFDDKEMNEVINNSGIIVNTTSIGMYPDVESIVDLPFSALNRESIVFDLIYNPTKTKLLEVAENAGCITLNGLYMLMFQAAESFKIWTGKDMPVEEVKKLLPQF